MKSIMAALLASVLVGALAPTAALAQQQCLRPNMVNGWKVINDQTLIVFDRVGRQYTVALAKGCTGLKWPLRLGFNSGLPGDIGLSCITRNDFVTVPASGGYVTQRCLINSVQPVGVSLPGTAAANH
jgi:Family of unknown function (DUF6491)